MEFLGAVLLGIVVALTVQALAGIYIVPAIGLREAIWAVQHSLIKYSAVYSKNSPVAYKDEAHLKLRDHAGALDAKSRALICYRVWMCLRILPKRGNVLKASDKLLYLSNLARTAEDATNRAIEAEIEIRRLLGIEMGTKEG